MKNLWKLDGEYFPEMRILGIVTGMKSYKLAWLINQKLEVTLCKTEDIDIPLSDNAVLPIECYVCETPHSFLRLLRNKSYDSHLIQKPFLVPELKTFDFLLLIENPIYDETSAHFLELIRTLPGIAYAQEIDWGEIKSAENLLF